MSNTSKTGFPPATISQIEQPDDPNSLRTVHIWAVYGGGNSLLFRCPCCGTIHAHGAGNMGGASDGATPSPHCTCDYPHFLNRKNFQWCLHELTEGMDISLAGNLSKKAKYICPRWQGEAGYDQLAQGRINYSASPEKLIAAYKKAGMKHG